MVKLGEMGQLEPDRTNEAVPASELPIIVDTIIDYIGKYPEARRLFVHSRVLEDLPHLLEVSKARTRNKGTRATRSSNAVAT